MVKGSVVSLKRYFYKAAVAAFFVAIMLLAAGIPAAAVESSGSKPAVAPSSVKLTDDISTDFTVSKGWVYYKKHNSKDIYRIKTDGSTITKLCDDNCQYIAHDGSWVYYSSYYDKAVCTG
jgi:hypothetical protein